MLDVVGHPLHGGLADVRQAGVILAGSDDLPQALADVAQLCVERLAEYCAIEISETAIPGGVNVVAGSLQPRSTEAKVATERLAAGGREFGRLVCVPRGGLSADFSDVMGVLAQLLAVAVTAHGLTQRERKVADRLQRALLPNVLPRVDGFELTAAYRPASDEAEIGGDWYDAFMLPDGRLAISVGDVAGHGLDAAVVMGELRQAARAAAVVAARPTEVLEQVNSAFELLTGTIGMVTAIFAFFDPRTSVLTYAVAGHPPVILALSDGAAWTLPLGSSPLGCGSSLDGVDWTFTLPKGATLFLYTDGLLENDRDVVRGERELIAAIRSVAASDEPSAERLQAAIFGDAPNRDDAATLTLTSMRDVDEYVFSPIPSVVSLARAVLGSSLARLSIEGERRFGALLAVTEALANAIQHGCGNDPRALITLRVIAREDGAEIVVEDPGRWRPFVKNFERGRGLQVMQAFTDGVQIRSTRTSTAVSLRIRTEPTAS